MSLLRLSFHPSRPSPPSVTGRRLFLHRPLFRIQFLHHHPPPPAENSYLHSSPTPPRRRLSCTPPTSSAAWTDESVGGFDEELSRLLVLLPDMRRRVEDHPERPLLVEVVMDLGRRPLARFPSGDFFLSDRLITTQDLNHAISQVGDFAVDNRAGISRTLHRISAVKNRKGAIIGLTCRVGRAVPGSADLLRDLVKEGESLLLIGPPGVGKTTIIRDIARMLADDYKKRVMIVDTSNEIGGDGDIPHAGIGSARRLQVPNSGTQHKVLIEAVENHMPHVIVIDEIGTKLEALAASTIAQRGIQLVATAHGITIENLIMNPSLEILVGGIQSVTLGDEEASRRGVQKTVLERKGPSIFTCSAEIISKTELRVHRSLEATVDALLSGRSAKYEVRKINAQGSTDEMFDIESESFLDVDPLREEETIFEDHFLRIDEKIGDTSLSNGGTVKLNTSCETGMGIHLYAYGISETSVLQAIKQLGMDEMVMLTDNISEAHVFLALHSKLKKNSQIQGVVKSHDIPIYVTKTSSLVQIMKAIQALVKGHRSIFKDSDGYKERSSEEADALEEVRLAIKQIVIAKGECAQLLPRPAHIISAQINMIEKYKFKWERIGVEPNASLCILPFQDKVTKMSFADQLVHTSDLEDFGGSDITNSSQNGVARLPFLPE